MLSPPPREVASDSYGRNHNEEFHRAREVFAADNGQTRFRIGVDSRLDFAGLKSDGPGWAGRRDEEVGVFIRGVEGGGWEVHWDGSRGEEFSQKTKVQAQAGGSVLRIKDARNYTTPGVSHSSTLDASIYYDAGARIYLWRGELPGVQARPLEANLIDVRTFQSGAPFTATVPLKNGARRKTIKVTESGEWHEARESLLSDGWFKSREAVLKRVK